MVVGGRLVLLARRPGGVERGVGAGCSSPGASGGSGVECGDANDVVDGGGDLEPGPVPGSALVTELSAGADFDLLLTDVVMPHMSGMKVVEKIRVKRPLLKVLLMSGYNQDPEVLSAIESGKLAFLPKPFTPDQLVKSVREVLARCLHRGVELKWFGAPEPTAFTSKYDSWRYAASEVMPATDRVLAGIVDMRVPLTFSLDDCALIARIIRTEVSAVFQAASA